MSDIWARHLEETLKGEDSVAAYMWDMEYDQFRWAGDADLFFGQDKSAWPQNGAQFNSLINPQQAPGRLSAIHAMFNSKPQGDASAWAGLDARVFYKLRQPDGNHLEVMERALTHEDSGPGRRILYGVLKPVRIEKNAASNLKGYEMEIERPSLRVGPGMIHQGRRMILRHLEEWADTFNASAKNKENGYLLLVGIDRLSLINEAFGLRYADAVIEKTGERLRGLVGDSGVVVRIDGDVFALLIEENAIVDMAVMAQYILNNFYEHPVMTGDLFTGVSVSIGGVLLDSPTRDAASFLGKAEVALRAAKDRGLRGGYVSYDSVSAQNSERKRMLAAADELMMALREDRIRLAFQPVLDAKTQRVSFHESLVRMIDRDGKIHTASQFVPAVEALGLSRIIDCYALFAVIQELERFPDLALSVNVSNPTLLSKEWQRALVLALRDRPSIAKRLIVEITENTVMSDILSAGKAVRMIRDLGCRVALDDFGAGFTTFSQLKDIEVDIVKIDKAYVRNMAEGQNHLFIKTLQTLADALDLKTVGEGVETIADARKLAKEGINHIQGYVFGFPRVERIWLPKGHVFRDIPLSLDKGASSDDADKSGGFLIAGIWSKSGLQK
ncbi:MAG: bifunctional diguanylate cyclase/phosphodiesterase [Proteobacteria bacterium]|nr:bifunctional diguanylate cyclase/phosphodiesterase [Pseudomonadota bacterium]